MIRSIKIISLFPALFDPLLRTKIFERAQEKVRMEVIDLREYGQDRRKTVDDTPYGGGCGMVLKPEPLSRAIEDACSEDLKRRVVCLSPQGKLFDHTKARELVDCDELVLICGRYEGIDQRIIDLYVDEEISIGDFVLAGGELPAMLVCEATLRFLPGVLGNEESSRTDSFSNGMFKYPQYTRPEKFKGLGVPDVLLSGDHGQIESWRREQALKKTRQVRPDLVKEEK